MRRQAFIEGNTKLFRSADIAPLEEGGAIVFLWPLSSRGYRLTEEEVNRFRQRRERDIRRTGRWWYVSIAIAVVLIIISRALPDYLYSGAFLVWSTLLTAFIIWYWKSYSRKFEQEFPNAERVKDSNRATRCLLAYLINPMYSMRRCLFNGVFFSFLSAMVIYSNVITEYSFTVRVFYILGIFILVIFSVLFLLLTFHHILFRIRHGRAPTEEDLKALSALPID